MAALVPCLASAARWCAWRALLGGVALLCAPALQAAVGVTIATTNATPTAGGAAFTYTVVITNLDAANPAPVVTLTLPLPPSVIASNPSATISGTGAASITCTTPPPNSNGTIVCTGASLAASAAATIAIVAQIVPDTATGVRTATARVQSGNTANTASVQINIQVSAPLTIAKTGPATIAQGANAVYQIAVTNNGTSTAINATIQDALPPNTTFVSMFGTGPFQNGCSASATSVVTCAAIDIPPGSHRLTIVAKTAPTIPLGNLTNTATIGNAGTGSISIGASSTTATVTP